MPKTLTDAQGNILDELEAAQYGPLRDKARHDDMLDATRYAIMLIEADRLNHPKPWYARLWWWVRRLLHALMKFLEEGRT